MLITDEYGNTKHVFGRERQQAQAIHRRHAKQAFTVLLWALDGGNIGEEELSHAKKILSEFVETR